MDIVFENFCTLISEKVCEDFFNNVFDDVYGSCQPIWDCDDNTKSITQRSVQCLPKSVIRKRISDYKKQCHMERYFYKNRKIVKDENYGMRDSVQKFHDYLYFDNTDEMKLHYNYPYIEEQIKLKQIAERIVASGKGILKADESLIELSRRFRDSGIPIEKKYRHTFMDILVTTDSIINEYISGITLASDFLSEYTSEGLTYVDTIRGKNILVGVRVDKGLAPLFFSKDEFTTNGLDDLNARCAEYEKYCDYAKWHSVLRITNKKPSVAAINDNAQTLARCASICQAHGLVPIVETKVFSIQDHTYLDVQKITEEVLAAVYKAFSDHHVYLEGTLIKVTTCIPGIYCYTRATIFQIAKATLTALQNTIPAAVAGITISAAGQTREEALNILDSINRTYSRKPWPVTFNYGFILQEAVLSTWLGLPGNIKSAQEALINCAKSASFASLGKYSSFIVNEPEEELLE